MTREEAIKLLCVEKSVIIEVDGNKGAEKILQAYDMAIEALENSEPKAGKWIRKENDVEHWLECSVCGARPPKTQWGNEWESPYCPECGAKMLGEDGEA